MRTRHIIPFLSIVLILYLSIPRTAAALDCFDYGGGWPKPVALPPAMQYPVAFTLLDGLAATVDATTGLTVADLGSNAVILNLPIPGYRHVAGYGRNLVLYDVDRHEAQFVNLDDPAHPVIRLLDSNAPGPISSVSIGDQWLAVVTQSKYVSVYDLDTMLETRGFIMVGNIVAPKMVGSNLLLCGQVFFAGLALVDCGPLIADFRDWVPLPDYGAFSVAVEGTTAYVSTQKEGIHIIDLANPDLLVDLGSFGAPGLSGAKLAARNGVLYALDYGLLSIYDVTDPTKPKLIAREPGQFEANPQDFSVGADGVLKVVDGTIVLLPLQCSAASAVRPEADLGLKVNIVPNPFNPAANISFALPAADAVTVEVYDLAGRLVRTLARGRALAAGAQAMHWDGRDDAGHTAASGVYLARVSGSVGIQEAKMTLVR